MSKKVLLIIGILVIVGAAAFLIFGSNSKSGNGTPGENTGFSFQDFLPFGKSGDSTTNVNPSSNTNNEPETNTPNISANQPIPRLRKISGEPVAGAVVFNVGTTTLVRFVEKGTGNVYEASSNSHRVERLTNTTIPRIIRSFWLPDGSGFLAQTIVPESEIVETNFVKLNKAKNPNGTSEQTFIPFETTISKLPTDIKEISINPGGTKIFYYNISNTGSNWYISNPDGTGSTLVNSHPLTEWLPKWIGANTIIMQTKSSSGSMGYTYSFDVANKTLKKVGVDLVGLSANPKSDGAFTLVSQGGTVPRLGVVDNKTLSLIDISVFTLSDKCVWMVKTKTSVYCAVPNQNINGEYPDDWYRGTLSTEDSLRKVDVINDIYYNTSNLSEESKEKIDVYELQLSADESHLLFKNKRDGYLWLLRIEE